ETIYRGLIASQALDYQLRARAIGQHLHDRNILNICGELNCISHEREDIRARFNFSMLGAAFYVAALLNLMRGGADAEMFWVGTEAIGGYGMLDQHGEPKPVFHAKKLCAQHVRYGDTISFPSGSRSTPPLDAVVARGEGGRLSGLLVHLSDKSGTYSVDSLDEALSDCDTLLKLDEGTGNRIVTSKCDGKITIDGYGVAVVTNSMPSG